MNKNNEDFYIVLANEIIAEICGDGFNANVDEIEPLQQKVQDLAKPRVLCKANFSDYVSETLLNKLPENCDFTLKEFADLLQQDEDSF